MNVWQNLPSHIDPVFLRVGSFQIRYYSLMYILCFVVVTLLLIYRIKKEKWPYTPATVENYFTWALLGVIIGARLGYVLFYNLDFYLTYPLQIVWPFDRGGHFIGIAGMSYHGGLLGAIVSSWLFCRRYRISFWRFADFVTPAVPLGYAFGRLGNFLNGELYGRPTDVPWGMYFPQAPDGQLRHPSQLYEMLFEGLFLFAVMWSIRKNPKLRGQMLPLYIIGYGTVRFFIEFFRAPDAQIGLLVFHLSLGQLLCLTMISLGAGLLLIPKTLPR